MLIVAQPSLCAWPTKASHAPNGSLGRLRNCDGMAGFAGLMPPWHGKSRLMLAAPVSRTLDRLDDDAADSMSLRCRPFAGRMRQGLRAARLRRRPTGQGTRCPASRRSGPAGPHRFSQGQVRTETRERVTTADIEAKTEARIARQTRRLSSARPAATVRPPAVGETCRPGNATWPSLLAPAIRVRNAET